MGDPYVGIVHPCKIYNVLALGIPFLYIGPGQSHVQDIITESISGAYAATHGDVPTVVASILAAKRRTDALPRPPQVSHRFSRDVLVGELISAIEETDSRCHTGSGFSSEPA